MNLAEAEPNATKKPMVKGSTSTIIAVLEAMKRLDGPAKGIMLKAKETPRMLRISRSVVSLGPLEAFVSLLELIKQARRMSFVLFSSARSTIECLWVLQ
jgi:hypothetical protein